ncbi:TIGR01212 family radical SAM protein [Candidatus Epulonipiscium fishelsonii]|uniref:TIGR01212 family radical SAM protein n=1 Tax=Candidatus Epulonipiscium fishelsonii TaxID=77094 RepID=A0ACC8XCD0_9FIRM|nr:TIGR01212 family radical SAM protein [Epulopiscium sp. SCG-B11WGA-EpuloA1]ONI43564.1 TIGR01212 family radical SAM protein [Epulopiscium sp. SCG-B05WGA-EpuloA1]
MYYRYSDYLKNKYGDKVYKIPINIKATCPNRDGKCGTGGCTFCDDGGVGYEMHTNIKPISEQIEENIAFIGKRYKAKYFIAYLQNYSNTYMEKQTFKEVLNQIKNKDFVGLNISTRPDCINDEYLEIIKQYQEETGYDICIELGLQTVNYHSLLKINRGHSLAEFIDAVNRIKKYNFEITVHLILNLPWDDELDVIENAKIMSALKINYVKLHALYILKNTVMGEQYLNGEINLISEDEYKQRVITFLRYLDPNIVIGRIIGRVPEEYAIFANWGTSWWKIHDEIIEQMQQNNYKQGDLCNYLNGKALK